MRRHRIVAAIAVALLLENAVSGPAIRDPLATLLDLLPDEIVEAGYAAVAHGLHLAAAAVAAFLLATALVMAAILRRRSPAVVVADRDMGPLTASRRGFLVRTITH